MSRTGTVVLVIFAIIAIIIAFLAITYGPALMKEGKAVVGPVMELAKSEELMKAVAEEFPFSEPEDGLVPEERLEAFLAIRRALKPIYENWVRTTETIEEEQGEGLDTVKDMLGMTRDVLRAQTDLLREQGMSPLEFRWMERLVYDQWLPPMKPYIAGETPTARQLLLDTTEEDLRYLRTLISTHGRTRALAEFEARLEERLKRHTDPDVPELEGDLEANHLLFWDHRDDILALVITEHGGLHARFRETGMKHIDIKLDDGTKLKIDTDGGGDEEAEEEPH